MWSRVIIGGMPVSRATPSMSQAAGQTSASTDIKITNNLMEQGKGTAVLGMWMQGGDIGYTNVRVVPFEAAGANGVIIGEKGQ